MRHARIFLVDDEQPVLDGLAVTIRNRLPELEICGTARSGREGVEAIIRERPDVAIVDVRMPGMSGLDAIREMRKFAPETAPILLTAYERFDVAKEAFALGVVDYLIKPASQDEIVGSVTRALALADERIESAKAAISAKDSLERARPLFLEGFLYASIYGEPESARAWAERAGVDEGPCLLAAVAERTPFGDLVAPDAECAAELRSALSYRLDCVAGPALPEGLAVFRAREADAAAFADGLGRALAASGRPALVCGVGRPYPSDALRVSWMEALSALGQAAATGPAPVVAVFDEDAAPGKEPAAHPGTVAPRSRLVRAAADRLRRRFRDPAVSLEETAGAVGANATYLSRAFAAETGMSFVDYLTSLRIEYAKRALLRGARSIKEIGSDSGYPDPNYFSRIFRKTAGMSPSEFARGRKEAKDDE